MKTHSKTLVTVAAIGAFAAIPAQAAVIATLASGGNNTFSVSSTDAADTASGGTASFAGTENFGSSKDKVIDGSVYGTGDPINTDDTLTPSVGDVLTLTLGAGDGAGWDVSSIVVLTGVHALQSGRSDHGYSIELSTDGTTFGSPIIAVSDSTTAGEVQVTISDNTAALLDSGVKAVRFTFSNAGGDAENMYREIDVNVPQSQSPSPVRWRSWASVAYWSPAVTDAANA